MSNEGTAAASTVAEARWAHARRAEWLGQMVASVLWVTSVFVYGIGSTGDVLQLGAAGSWLIANLDALRRAGLAMTVAKRGPDGGRDVPRAGG
ncbi:MAG: hypothetical protein AAGA48_09335 [Myxococcota bacterium]